MLEKKRVNSVNANIIPNHYRDSVPNGVDHEALNKVLSNVLTSPRLYNRIYL